jgi:integrase
VERRRLGQLARPTSSGRRRSPPACPPTRSAITRRGKTSGPTTSVRPRDLRGSFATLLIYEGHPVTEVAEQLGNSAAQCLRDYAGVFDEYARADRVERRRRHPARARRCRHGH